MQDYENWQLGVS